MKAAFISSSGGLCHTRTMPPLLLRASGLALLAAVFAVEPLQSRENASTVVTFGGSRGGTLPAGFRTLTSVDGEPGRWQAVVSGRHTVLGQTDLGSSGYRLAVRTDVSLADVHLGVRLRMMAGDRAAGLAWRVQDVRNYYAARLDFDTNEVVLYKFVRGSRVRLDRRTGLRLDPAAWHELSVDHVGPRIRVWLNGVPVADDEDDTLAEAGTLGFWMPGDGTAHFERLWYRALDAPR
jgi:hypothetical protein